MLIVQTLLWPLTFVNLNLVPRNDIIKAKQINETKFRKPGETISQEFDSKSLKKFKPNLLIGIDFLKKLMCDRKL